MDGRKWIDFILFGNTCDITSNAAHNIHKLYCKIFKSGFSVMHVISLNLRHNLGFCKKIQNFNHII